jgi:hypothetical protein
MALEPAIAGGKSMRGKWMVIVISILSLGAFMGCKSDPKLKPPTHPEELLLPPVADSRYNSPDYPKAALKDSNDRPKPLDDGPPGMAGRSMAGAGRMSPGGGMPY